MIDSRYVIKSIIGTYYIEIDGVGGWSKWKSHAKTFASYQEASNFAIHKEFHNVTIDMLE